MVETYTRASTGLSDHPGDIELISQPEAYSFAEGWYELSSETHFWFRWRLLSLLEQLKDLGISTEQAARVLDVGAGMGVLRSQLESATRWTVDITDLDLEALKQAKPGRGRRMYYNILEQRAPFLEAYDQVILFDVLEHIPDTQPLIRALLGHLRPGGRLLINVPALQSLHSHYDEIVGHVRRYNKKTLAAEFKPHGLEIEDIRYWGLSLTPALAARKLLFKFLRQQPGPENVRRGLQPPNQLVHNLFLGLMHLEQTSPFNPPIGSSLLLIARKL